MGSIVLTTLSVFLGLFFLFVGSLKVTATINREMHREIRRNYIQYSRVFPFSQRFGFKVSPKVYRLAVGFVELFSGALLAFAPGFAKQLANTVLLVLTLNALYTHLAIDDKFERTAPSIVFSLMLSCRLIILWQVRRRERQQHLTLLKAAAAGQRSIEAETVAKKED
ncbi:transmembrane protein 35-like protein [Dinothrombium tinctorium]|uniref:Novel acetylcholine receptor chaperone n=1 Tax=Dinothrombium tinctorium TaxID=1965070 RepID=A0A443QXY1_9ACAR|nr:transmembrane protein 35-like protein [Dinothrombium tinctorium]